MNACQDRFQDALGTGRGGGSPSFDLHRDGDTVQVALGPDLLGRCRRLLGALEAVTEAQALAVLAKREPNASWNALAQAAIRARGLAEAHAWLTDESRRALAGGPSGTLLDQACEDLATAMLAAALLDRKAHSDLARRWRRIGLPV